MNTNQMTQTFRLLTKNALETADALWAKYEADQTPENLEAFGKAAKAADRALEAETFFQENQAAFAEPEMVTA